MYKRQEYNGDKISHYSNRCQFTSEFDFRKAREKDFEHPNNAVVLNMTLETRDIDAQGNILSLNDIDNVNNALPFFFTQELIAQNTLTIPNEGKGNVELTGEDIRFAGLAGSTKDNSGIICSGSGFCYDDLLAITGDYRLNLAAATDTLDTTITNGALSKVIKGDVVYIKKSTDVIGGSGDTFGACLLYTSDAADES